MSLNRGIGNSTVSAIRVRPRVLLFLASSVLFLSVFDRIVISGIPLMRTLSGLVGVILALLWAMSRLPAFRFDRRSQLWLIFLLIGIVTIDLGRFIVTGHLPWSNSLQWVQSLIFAVILFDLSKDPRAFKMFGTAIFLAVLYMALFSFIGPESRDGRIGLHGINLNTQAYIYALAWITCLAVLLDRWPRFKVKDIFIVAMALVFVFAQLRTGSRGAILATAVGAATLLLLMANKRNLSAYVSIVPIFIAATAVFLMMGSIIILERIGFTLSSGDLGYRDVIFEGAIKLFQQNPIFGAGPDFVEQLGVITRGKDTSTHNAYLQVGTAYGLTGLALFAMVIFSTLKSCWRHRRSFHGALVISLIVLSISYGVTADLAFVRYFWAVMALAAGMPALRESLSHFRYRYS